MLKAIYNRHNSQQSKNVIKLFTGLLGTSLMLTTLNTPAIQMAHAEELVIDISKQANETPTIAIVPFANDTILSPIIANDLSHSGKFALDKQLPEQPHTSNQINLPLWQRSQVPYLVVGQTIKSGNSYDVQYELIEINSGKRLLGEKIVVPNGRMREAAHLIADKIYQALTGIPGDFSGRIAYVLRTRENGKPIFSLQIADADGHAPQTVIRSVEPILSPTWLPSGDKIAYVSFETGKPAIYLQNLSSGNREVLTQYAGINSSPSFSPDGKRMLFTGSMTGNPEIYIMDLASRKIQQLTNNSAIDTEPSFAANGRSFVFTSDRGGSPQIYLYNLNNGQTRRLTFTGSYNARGSLSSDGKSLSLLHRCSGQRFQAAVMDIASGIIRPITTTSLDESPSFSPNGQMIVYATKQKGRGLLSVMTTDGRFRMDLPSAQGEVREPAWAPKR